MGIYCFFRLGCKSRLPLRLRFLAAGMTLLFIVMPGHAVIPESEEANIEADSYEFDQTSGWAEARGNVQIEYGELTILADSVSYHPEDGEVIARDNIELKSTAEDPPAETFSWKTDKLWGNLHDEEFRSEAYTLSHGSVFLRGPEAEYTQEESFNLPSAQISTCEHLLDSTENAHFHVHTRNISYSRETERFRILHSVVKIGPVPILYWPVFYWDRDWMAEDLSLQAGYENEWGAFIKASRHWQLTDDVSTRLGVEARSQRGLALSSTTRRTGEDSESELSLYGMRDSSPPETEPGFNRRFKTQKDRYRFQFYHRHQFGTDWNLRLRLDKLSDIDMLEEWFEKEYDHSPQPRSFADLRYRGEHSDFSISARPRINDFYTVVERLPELRWEIPRQTIFDSPFYYQGEHSLANLHMRWRDFDRPPRLATDEDQPPEEVDPALADPQNYRAWRFDSLHMFYRPFDLGNDIQWTPRAGARMTHYTRSSKKDIKPGDLAELYEADSPDRARIDPERRESPLRNYDSRGGSVTRWAAELGMELSKKYQKLWPDARIPHTESAGVRLITRPYSNYTYIPEPSQDRANIYHFDRVDRVMKQNFVRLGVENRLQTRRPVERDVHTVLRMNTYADFHLETPRDRGNLGNLAANIEITPKDKFSFNTMLITDMDEPQLNYMQSRATLKELLDTAADFSLSYSFSNDYRSTELNSMGSTLLDYRGESLTALEFSKTNETMARLDFPIGEKTEAALGFGYDFEEGGASRQLVEISRNLHCWTGVIRYERRGTGDNARTEASIMFYLSAFPGLGAGLGM